MKKHTFTKLFCASILIASSVSSNGQGIIRTIAGTGLASFSGDGGPAIGATFSNPSGVATDVAGNIYIADYYNHRIRFIDVTDGNIYTIAGNGVGTYSGMGGLAKDMGMRYPNSIFVGSDCSYYVSDHFADAVYEIKRSGSSSSSGGHGHGHGHGHGDHNDDNGNNDGGNNCQGNSGDGGDASLATMKIPRGVWKDKFGNKYIADYGNNKVRMINTSHIMSTFTGGISGFSPNGTPVASCAWGSINGICTDAAGNVYVSDGANHVVRKINITTGLVNTIAGNGTAGYSGDNGSPVMAKLHTPGNLFINSSGNLFICDAGNHTIRVMNVNSNFTVIKTVAGTGTLGFSGDGGPADAAKLNQPSGVWEDASGTIYIADMGNQRVRSIVGSGYKNVNGLVNTTADNSIVIYPNPSRGTFTVLTGTVQANTTIEVFNIFGQKVNTTPVIMPQTTISLSQPAGIYTVVVSSSTGSTTQQVVIND